LGQKKIAPGQHDSLKKRGISKEEDPEGESEGGKKKKVQ